LLVDIRTLDLTDDAELLAAFEVLCRAEELGREDAPHWTRDSFFGYARSHDSGERRETRVGYVDGELVAFGGLELSLLDNTDKGWVEVRVDPDHRRRGYGRAMMEHLVAIADADGRTQLMSEAKVPIDEVETHPYSQFLKSLGFIHANVELVRYQTLPVDDAVIQGWVDQAAERHDGYKIETYGDDLPAELIPPLCTLYGQLAVDAPTGEVDFEEEVMTPERFAERQERVKAMGRTILESLAIAPDGTVAAQSTLSVPVDADPDVWQWGTFVHRQHRGHRLGLAVKAANLRALQTQFPDKRRVVTQNGETNDFMVSINVLMGFELVEASAEFVRRA
jgi:GNAT superfamily N-acetyltransferase